MNLRDRILEKGTIVPQSAVGRLDHDVITYGLDSAVVLRADNAFDHLVRIGKQGREGIVIAELPSSLPPWPSTFIEWNYDHRLAGDWFPWRNMGEVQAGWLIVIDDPKSPRMMGGHFWLYGLYDEDPGVPHGPICSWQCPLDSTGHIERKSMQAKFFDDGWGEKIAQMIRDSPTGLLSHLIRQIWMPAAFAIGLMHCKNVEIVDAFPPRHEARERKRQNLPPVQFKELVIDPNMSQKRYAGAQRATEGEKVHKSLHIVRGHFAAYGEENRLFGKYTGTFWKPAHTRGSDEVGTVFKDYRVKA